MKSKRVADLVFVLVFLLLIVLVTALTVFGPEELTSEYENRYLAKRPVLDPAIMFDDGYALEWERYFTDHAAWREPLLMLATSIDLNIIKRPTVNGIVVLDDLYLEYLEFTELDEAWLRQQSRLMADEMAALNDVVSSYGGEFFYVAVPTHESWYDYKYPWYLNSNKRVSELTLETFIPDMAAAGVEMVLPFWGLTPEDTFDGHPLYFTSDHHFSFYGAYMTYRTIIEKINSSGKNVLPLLENDDFEFYTLPNPFMGSHTRKLLNIPDLTERATIAVLNEAIPFTRSDNGVAFQNHRIYFMPADADSVIDYGLYMGGDSGETFIETNRELPSILLFGDSMTNAVECLLYASAGEFRSIDLRYYDEMALSEYVEIYKPDIVICMRGYANLTNFDGNGTVMK